LWKTGEFQIWRLYEDDPSDNLTMLDKTREGQALAEALVAFKDIHKDIL